MLPRMQQLHSVPGQLSVLRPQLSAVLSDVLGLHAGRDVLSDWQLSDVVQRVRGRLERECAYAVVFIRNATTDRHAAS